MYIKLLKINILLITTIIFIFNSCSNKQAANIKTIKNSNTNFNKRNIFIEKDTFNETAKFIAGLPTDLFKNIQDKIFVKTHNKITNNAWSRLKNKTIKPIKHWKNKNISSLKSCKTLFYPFSGPDFLYADLFFPACNNYIFVGLENSGNFPNLNQLNDSIINSYLINIRKSMRFINSNSYFVTKQMKDDLDNNHLNGILHIILFYLARLDYEIIDFTYVYIDQSGYTRRVSKQLIESNKIDGFKLLFKKQNTVNYKTLYYFPFDLSDINITDRLEFLFFLNQFREKCTFMKSASYLLHSNNFKIIKNLILKQSKIIIQDDSGIPFNELNKNFKCNVYGKYSKTINTFDQYFQQNLADSINKQTLPFRFGYNTRLNETVLIVAEKTKSQQLLNHDLTYKIQIMISWDKIPINSDEFSIFEDVDYYFDSGYYKYTIGSFKTEEECTPLLEKAKKNGYEDAFILAFYKGKRITLDEANTIINKTYK